MRSWAREQYPPGALRPVRGTGAMVRKRVLHGNEGPRIALRLDPEPTGNALRLSSGDVASDQNSSGKVLSVGPRNAVQAPWRSLA